MKKKIVEPLTDVMQSMSLQNICIHFYKKKGENNLVQSKAGEDMYYILRFNILAKFVMHSAPPLACGESSVTLGFWLCHLIIQVVLTGSKSTQMIWKPLPQRQ